MTSSHGANSAKNHKHGRRANPFLTIIQCISTRDIELYCGNVFLGAAAPTEPGNSDEVAEIYTVALIELIDVLERMSNHERMLVVEGFSKPLDLLTAPSRPSLLTTAVSRIGVRSNEISWKSIS